MSTPEEKYDGLADGFSEREYADPARYSAGRARLVVELGPRLERGATVVDLGCGDGIMAGPLGGVRARLHRASTRASRWSRRRAAASRPRVRRRALRGLRAARAGRRDDLPARVLLPGGPASPSSARRRLHAAEVRLRLPPGASTPADSVARDLRAAGFSRIELRPFFMPQRRALPGSRCRARRRSSAPGRSRCSSRAAPAACSAARASECSGRSA